MRTALEHPTRDQADTAEADVLVLNAGSSSLKFALFPCVGDRSEGPAPSGPPGQSSISGIEHGELASWTLGGIRAAALWSSAVNCVPHERSSSRCTR